jgi:chondroitin 4-sulfotransferase 11
MPINHNLKCIFIHIPKAGGSTIERMLDMEVLDEQGFANVHDDNRLFGRIQDGSKNRYLSNHLQHLTAHEVKQRVGEAIWDEYFKFAIVRNPWDRMVSIYKYGDGSLRQQIKTTFGKKYEELGFREFVEISKTLDLTNIHLLPQYEFIEHDNRLIVDYIGYYENYNKTVKEILSILGLKEQYIPVTRKSKRTKSYWQYYTPRTYQKVKKLYHKDIQKLNYSFIQFR